MPPKGKAKLEDAHPIDASGILQAAKDGDFADFKKRLVSQTQLTFEDFNCLVRPRSMQLRI